MAAKMTKPEMINQQVGWCPGCGHGIIQRLIAECCEELGLCEKTIQVVDIACAYWSIDTLNCDGIAGPHGALRGSGHSNQKGLSGFQCLRPCRGWVLLCDRPFRDLLRGPEECSNNYDRGK